MAIKKYLSHEKINVYRTLVTDQGSIKTLIFPRYFNADFLLNKNFRQHRFRSRRKLLSGCLSRDRPRKQYNPKYREGGGRPPLQLDSGNTPARCVSCSLFNLCNAYNCYCFNQFCGSGLDPDSVGSLDPDPDPGGQK